MVDNYDSLPEVVKVKVEKYNKLCDDGRYPYKETKYDVTAHAKEIIDNFENYDGKTVRIAGRIMAKRGQGKVAFFDVQDSSGKIQLFNKKDILGEEYPYVLSYDIGDIIGIEGTVFKTQRGEISLRSLSITLLSKSIQVLPEKFHGLKDMDLRYRQRYVDLIVNPEVKDVFVLRTNIIKAIKEFMDSKGFLEVETPVLATLAGGANARPFVTHHNTLNIPMYMRIATELSLKRLIVGGFDKVYEIGRLFRNEGMDATHNPEFTTMESYEAYADFNDVMDMVEELLSFVSVKVLGTTNITYDGHDINLAPPFRRVKMTQLVKEYTGVDFDAITDLDKAKSEAAKIGIEPESGWGIGKIIEEAFDKYVEDKLIQPTYVTHHPTEISPLAKKCFQDERYTERFELFIAGHEYANAFSELNDPFDQKERFEAQMLKKAGGDEEAHPYDKDFINALEVGLPPTGGLGLGIDRLVMLMTGQTSIRDVILFPTMKPLKDVNAGNDVVNNTPETVSNDGKAEPEKIDFSKVEIEPLFKDFVDFETFSKSDFRAVKVLACEAVPKSKKLLKFTLDDGSSEPRTILSGIHEYYEPEELVGKTCIAITNLPPRAMMGIDSCGMMISAVYSEEDKEKLHLLMVDNHIPAGAKLY